MTLRCHVGAFVLLSTFVVASPARAQAPPPPLDPPPPPPNHYDSPSRSEFPPPDAPRPPPPPPDHGFSTKFFAGPAYQRIFDTSIPGAELGAFVGGVQGTSGWYGGFDTFLGRMDYGLLTWAVGPRAMWEVRLGRAHLGLSLGFVIVSVQRATTTDSMMSFGAGPSVFATVDLYQAERHALFLGAKLRVDAVVGSDASGNAPALWGPTAQVGWRYR
jgi:hypothetical protein